MELRPCPFCGSANIGIVTAPTGAFGESLGAYGAKCECGASYWHPSLGKCNWNTRYADAEIAELRENLSTATEAAQNFDARCRQLESERDRLRELLRQLRDWLYKSGPKAICGEIVSAIEAALKEGE